MPSNYFLDLVEQTGSKQQFSFVDQKKKSRWIKFSVSRHDVLSSLKRAFATSRVRSAIDVKILVRCCTRRRVNLLSMRTKVERRETMIRTIVYLGEKKNEKRKRETVKRSKHHIRMKSLHFRFRKRIVLRAPPC